MKTDAARNISIRNVTRKDRTVLTNLSAAN